MNSEIKKSFSGATPSGPIMLIHGGAGGMVPEELLNSYRSAIQEIINSCWTLIQQGASAKDVVLAACEQFETLTIFDAGRGSDLQADGSPRLSAAVMDGSSGRFAGAHLVENTPFPSKIANALLSRKHRVMGSKGSNLVAREIGLEVEIGPSEKQVQKWLEDRKKQQARETGTVGAVAIDKNGALAAATSTGGTSNCYPGRMSDVGTIASTYASEFSAISGTGIGEEIVEAACAARLDTRVRDGQTIIEASDKLQAEAIKQQQRFGWISLDHNRNWAARYTTNQMAFAMKNESVETALVIINNS